MNRTLLEGALHDLAHEAGWEFHSAPEATMASQIIRFPTLWLTPPKLLEKEGHTKGRIRYGTTLHLLTEGARLSPQNRSNRMALMEQKLISLLTQLSECDTILSIEKLTLTPRTFAFTPHGDLALTAECEIFISY